jgi:hypothetical protein
MIANLSGEMPSLTMLYGDSIQDEISRQAAMFNVSPDDVRAQLEQHPEYMGAVNTEGVANVLKAVGQGATQAATMVSSLGKPAVAPGGTAAPAKTTWNILGYQVSPAMVLIPAAGIIGFMVVRSMKRADGRGRRR